MAYASWALRSHSRRGRAVGVSDLFGTADWRLLVVYFRSSWQFSWCVWRFLYTFFLWLPLQPIVMLLECCGVDKGLLASAMLLRPVIMYFVLLTMNGLSNPPWKAFWYAYFIVAEDLDTFIMDYCEAWASNVQLNYDKEIVLFVENGHRLAIPCSDGVDDKQLIGHIRTFYYLILATGGLQKFLGMKSSTRIEVVQLENRFVVGSRVGAPLDLGRYGPYNRQIHYFRDPSELTGTRIKERLLSAKDTVMTAPGQQSCGLNIVRTWNPRAVSVTVLIPVVASFCISVAWSVVASVHFKADAQASTQTGFTIGSYVVTASTLLIALLAFLDTKYNVNEMQPPSTGNAQQQTQQTPPSRTAPTALFQQPVSAPQEDQASYLPTTAPQGQQSTTNPPTSHPPHHPQIQQPSQPHQSTTPSLSTQI